MRDAELTEMLALDDRFPSGIAGEEIDGVDLVRLDDLIIGVASHYPRNRSPITPEHRAQLLGALDDLGTVWRHLAADAQTYFVRRRAIARYLLDHRSEERLLTRPQDWYQWYKHRGVRGLRAIAMATWDPLGVLGIPEATDEYDGYLGLIADRLRRGATVAEVAGLLARFRAEDMGLGANEPEDRLAAREMSEWHKGAAPDGDDESATPPTP